MAAKGNRKNGETAKKILIIGIDGGTWKILKPLMQKGMMPSLKKLYEGGARGTLESTIPPITPVAWTSFMTGCNPDKHGILNFMNYYKNNNHFDLVNARRNKAKTIWEILSDNDYRSISINVPMTYPPKKIRGNITLSGLMTPSSKSDYCNDESVKQEIERKFGGYPVWQSRGREKMKDLSYHTDHLLGIAEKRLKIALHLMKNYQWDVMMYHFQETDFLQHFFYDRIIPSINKSSKKPASSEEKKLHEFYSRIDSHISKLIKQCSESTDIFVISDHGFEEDETNFYSNTWLYQKGCISLKKSPKAGFMQMLLELVRKIDRWELRTKILKKKSSKVMKFFYDSFLDLENSAAFAQGNGPFTYLYIMKKGNKIAKELSNVKFKGKKVFSACYSKKHLYSNPHSEFLPDYVLTTNRGFSCLDGFGKKKLFGDPKERCHTGQHDSDGIFIINGKDVRRGGFKAKITDIIPTLLYRMGVPCQNLDGDTRKDMFYGGQKSIKPHHHKKESARIKRAVEDLEL
ncbi:MAG: alkaline phosphatase family protein [Candidatus Woesearchaeota archaeon]